MNFSINKYIAPKVAQNEKTRKVSKTKKSSRPTHYLLNDKNHLMVSVIHDLIGPLVLPRLDASNIVEKHIGTYNSFLKNLGPVKGTQHYKAIVLYCWHLVEAREEISMVPFCGIGLKDRWPNCFGYLRPLFHFIRDNISNEGRKAEVIIALQALNTLFGISKLSVGVSSEPIKVSETFLIDPQIEERYRVYLRSRLGRFGTPNGRILENLAKCKAKLYVAPSNGPNGLPRVQSAIAEWRELKNSPLYEPFMDIVRLTGSTGMVEYAEMLHTLPISADSVLNPEEPLVPKDRPSKLKPVPSSLKRKKVTNNPQFVQDKTILRRITQFPEKGNKVRTIALCDYWTQSLLTGLEDFLIKHLLENFERSTCFYSHSEGFAKAKLLPKDCFSLDANAWTDNFPATFQKILLTELLGGEYGDSWFKLAARCEWNFHGTIVTYGKGQGMGTKSSFVLASCADHYFIEMIMQESYGRVLPYVKVGDDLHACDPDGVLKDAYESIGVPINLNKSKIMTSLGQFCELVSRNAWDGLEYSAISSNLLRRCRNNPFYVVILCEHINERSSLKYDPVILLGKLVLTPAVLHRNMKTLDLYSKISGEVFQFPPEYVRLSSKEYLTCLANLALNIVDQVETWFSKCQEADPTIQKLQSRILKYKLEQLLNPDNEVGVALDFYQYGVAQGMSLTQLESLNALHYIFFTDDFHGNIWDELSKIAEFQMLDDDSLSELGRYLLTLILRAKSRVSKVINLNKTRDLFKQDPETMFQLISCLYKVIDKDLKLSESQERSICEFGLEDFFEAIWAKAQTALD